MKTIIEKDFVRFLPNGRPKYAEDIGRLQRIAKECDRKSEIRMRILKARVEANIALGLISFAFGIAILVWWIRSGS